VDHGNIENRVVGKITTQRLEGILDQVVVRNLEGKIVTMDEYWRAGLLCGSEQVSKYLY
jgi:hypothetical protein